MAEYTFIDASGLGNSGKSAAVDLLREVDGIYVPPYWFELDIIRTPDGLLELRHRLLTDWSSARAHHAIRAFISAAEKMGRSPRWWDISGHLRATGHRYDQFFHGEFTRLSREFALSFVMGSFPADWPFDFQYDPGWKRLSRKFLRKLRIQRGFRSDILLPSGDEFDRRARAYLNALYELIVPPGTKFVSLNNGLEPFNPVPGLNMLGDARQIVVTRDPRDVYVSGQDPKKIKAHDPGLVNTEKNYGLHSKFLATENLQLYVIRQKLFYDHLYNGIDPRILHLRFEDLIQDYDACVDRILGFLGIPASLHVRKRQYFRPDASAQNKGTWKKYRNTEELDYIALHLPEALVP